MSRLNIGNAGRYARASRQSRTNKTCVEVRHEEVGSRRKIADRIGRIARTGWTKVSHHAMSREGQALSCFRFRTFDIALADLATISTTLLHSWPTYLT